MPATSADEGAREWEALFLAVRHANGLAPEDRDREAGLTLATKVGLRTAPGTIGCSITAAHRDGTYTTPAASGELAVDLDRIQYEAGDGPCLRAARDGRPQRMVRTAAAAPEQPWPEFRARARGWGVHSSLSLPLPGAVTDGALNLYSSLDDGFRSVRAQNLATLVAEAVTAFLDDQHAPGSPEFDGVSTAQLERAMAERALIQHAQQFLRLDQGLDAAEAFRVFTARSVSERRPLREIAQELLGERDGERGQNPTPGPR